MENHDQTSEEDIARQRYKGTNAAIAGLGAGSIVHWGTAIIGLVIGGVGAYLFHEPSTKLFKQARDGIETLQTSRYEIKRLGGTALNWILSSGQGFAESITNISFIKRALGKMEEAERVKIGVEGGVFASVIGSFTGIFIGGTSGVRSAHRGKKQFEDAKEEITSLRATNARLRNKLVETEFTLEDLKTADAAKHGTLKVAADEPPVVAAEATPESTITTSQASLIDSLAKSANAAPNLN